MVGICFAYNSGYKSLLRDQYFELAKAFPGLTLYERGTPASEPDTYNDQAYTKVTNADDLPIKPQLVVLSGQDSENIKGDISLAGYRHPVDVIYFFGNNQEILNQEQIGIVTDYDKVYIPIKHNVWSAQAISMVLIHRQLTI